MSAATQLADATAPVGRFNLNILPDPARMHVPINNVLSYGTRVRPDDATCLTFWMPLRSLRGKFYRPQWVTLRLARVRRRTEGLGRIGSFSVFPSAATNKRHANHILSCTPRKIVVSGQTWHNNNIILIWYCHDGIELWGRRTRILCWFRTTWVTWQ